MEMRQHASKLPMGQKNDKRNKKTLSDGEDEDSISKFMGCS